MAKMKKVEEDLEEIKHSLNSLTSEIEKVNKQQGILMLMMDQIKELKNLIKEKDKTIQFLERKVDDLEQQARLEEVIITGLETKHRSYARVTESGTGAKRGEDEPPMEELQSLERQVVEFFSNKKLPLHSNNISACYTLPRRHTNAPPAIVVRFVNRKHKVDLLRRSSLLKGSGVYLNEHLTKRNADIARQARILRKEKKIQATWTRNCKVMIKLNGTPEEAKVITIKDLEELDIYTR